MRRVSIEEIDRRRGLWVRLTLHVETQCRYALLVQHTRDRLLDQLGVPVAGDLCDK